MAATLMNTHLCAEIGRCVLLLDRVVGEMIRRCEFEGQSYCDWTVRLQHHYIELRQAWLEAGGDLEREHLTLDAAGTVNHKGPICAVQENPTKSLCPTLCSQQ